MRLWRARTNFGNEGGTSKSMFLMCFLDLKFASADDHNTGELQIQHTRRDCDVGLCGTDHLQLSVELCAGRLADEASVLGHVRKK